MKINITVVYGGPGNEHEVSVASAKNVISVLDVEKYSVQTIFIQKDMSCLLNEKKLTLDDAISSLTPDTVIIPILHGAYGEGGTFQKILEDRNIRYVWSGSVASALAIDKYVTERILQEHNIKAPKTIIVSDVDKVVTIPFPLIVKPRDEGSSVDLHKVTSQEDLQQTLKETLSRHSEILVQECVIGREFTCGVIEKKGELIPLLPTEIILTKGELFDYNAKYTVGGCEEITPAQVSAEVTKKLQEVAVTAHKALNCRDISRTDMIMKDDGAIVVLEVNTIPGMTKTSFIPAQAKASGYTLSQILDIVIDNHI